MLSSFIITFRESLEASLIIGVILGYLSKTSQQKQNKIVYAGVLVGVIGSILGAFLFNKLAGGFEGKAEEIFEGITMIIGAILLITVILWMQKQKNIAQNLQNKIGVNIGNSGKISLFTLSFISVLREGIETVIFLSASTFASGENSLTGAILGILTAIVVGILVFFGSLKINVKKFFNITSILLVILAIWLFIQGLHEFEEAGLFPELF
jgi:high-affinity iron transporter